MERPKCSVKGCENNALTLYGTRWICGECMIKIINKQKEKQDKIIEELEND